MLTILKNHQLLEILYLFKKNSGKGRMITDLRPVNEMIQPMGSLHSEIPLPTLLTKGWPFIVIDLKKLLLHYTYPYNKTSEKICLHSAYLE